MTLEEHYQAIQAAIDAAESEGFMVEPQTCCCGQGLVISAPGSNGPEISFNV